MDLQRLAGMDVNILVSLLNTRLRNEQVDPDELVRRHGIERAALEDHLAAHGFVYLPGLRQFRTPG